MSSVPEPPRGFRGVFLWVPTPTQLAAGRTIAAADLPDALSAFLGVTPQPQPREDPVSLPDPPASQASGVSPPWVGIVVLGRWLGEKPGDSGFGVQCVDRVDRGFEVRLGTGDLVVRVGTPGDGMLLKEAPYGELLVIPQAHDVTVTRDGVRATRLPSVRDGVAFDMRGDRARAWPRRRAYTERSPFATRHPVPALMLSVWRARPIPEALLAD